MFANVCAFPFVPFQQGAVDEAAYVRILQRLAQAEVPYVCALGSTGNYAYMNLVERMRIAQCTREHLPQAKLMVGISSLRVADVLALADHALHLGADALLLAPMSYQPLSGEEMLRLYRIVHDATTLPICVYDNPGTTHYTFTPEQYAQLAQLPRIRGVKIPRVSEDMAQAKQQVQALKTQLPPNFSVGISGDWWSTAGLVAGCDVWYSVLAGAFPRTAMEIGNAVAQGHHAEALALSARLQPLWALFQRYGSLRVIATALVLQGVAAEGCLPAPLLELQGNDREHLRELLTALALH